MHVYIRVCTYMSLTACTLCTLYSRQLPISEETWVKLLNDILYLQSCVLTCVKQATCYEVSKDICNGILM